MVNRRQNKSKTNVIAPVASWRYKLVAVVFIAVFLMMILRAIFLQIVDAEYLQSQGNARYLRVQKEMPTRGMITDQHGQPLAISTPVDTLWVHPPTIINKQKECAISKQKECAYDQLAQLLQLNKASFLKKVKKNQKREFMYLKRHLSPKLAQQVMDLSIPGVNKSREYKRYYPAGPVFGHVLGFTNIDGEGQEGVELSFNEKLQGQAGRTHVLQDNAGHVVEYVEQLSRVQNGENVTLSIDSKIQYLAYRYIQAAVKQHKASSASLVALDAKTGEILAMVSAPDFNPNNRSELTSVRFRNRSITDLFEPGSTMKPFVVGMALEQSLVTPQTLIETDPGYLYVGKSRISDTHNSGLISVAGVIQESSNVGIVKIAMKLPAIELYKTYRSLGFGQKNQLSIPGEAKGILAKRKKWRPIEHATLSYGYGLSANTLQLARAYQTIANKGVMLPVTLQKVDEIPKGKRVFSEKTALQIKAMLEMAVSSKGTAPRARVDKYRVAGKTGTAHLLLNGRYQDDSYMSIFAGFAPASDPDIVMVIAVNDPRGVDYYGGLVAAPVFSKVMEGALRFRNITPDKLDSQEVKKSPSLVITQPKRAQVEKGKHKESVVQ